ncbi:biopolymer transport protein ExbD [bacterium BMS3Abin07]|nr:biopolymer transport protein ExbD [bacterium BMS3Abin07]GBE32364.1 biopolymer transport protein ExbD [bacterium BMS3Bbin05]HDL20556.1 protein TolR [Nitrospirota bacterium]HDO21363.1 protein TolR [Nitrospirota bacterium]HDZ88593.1 protein TolR [Nitrospirota bacterium]
MDSGKNRSVLSDINVTPLVDVMLVLLIIFMVTAPMMKQGIDVDLPQAKGKSLPAEERFVIVMKSKGTLYLNNKKITMSRLVAKLRAVSKINPDVYLKADKRVSYGKVMELMAEIKEAGVEKLGMVTEPRMKIR